MTLKKEGFVCRIAYFFFVEKEEIPKRVSICPLFWRFFWNLLIVIPFVLTINGLGFLLGFFFAARPAIFKGDGQYNSFVQYHRWPRLFGFRLLPIYPFMIGIVWGLAKTSVPVGITFAILGTVGIYAFAGFSHYLLTRRWEETAANISGSETWRFFTAYLKAKKEKVCPYVEIVN